MKYFKFYFDIGYYTGEDQLYVQYKDDVSIDQISQDCEESFYEHISSFSHLILTGFNEEDYFEDIEDYTEEDYLHDYIINFCIYTYYEITEEEYKQARKDGYLCI